MSTEHRNSSQIRFADPQVHKLYFHLLERAHNVEKRAESNFEKNRIEDYKIFEKLSSELDKVLKMIRSYCDYEKKAGDDLDKKKKKLSFVIANSVSNRDKVPQESQ
jgi:hypothetical protein